MSLRSPFHRGNRSATRKSDPLHFSDPLRFTSFSGCKCTLTAQNARSILRKTNGPLTSWRHRGRFRRHRTSGQALQGPDNFHPWEPCCGMAPSPVPRRAELCRLCATAATRAPWAPSEDRASDSSRISVKKYDKNYWQKIFTSKNY